MKLEELGVTEAEWARLYRAGQVDTVPNDISPGAVLAEVRRIVSGEDAPYEEGPPFDRLAGLTEWLDRHGSLAGAGTLEWLGGRGRRRVEAVEAAYRVLGLDYGKGHLDDLYAAAYDHAFRDAWAIAAQMMQDRFSDTLPGHLWAGYVALYEQARGEHER